MRWVKTSDAGDAVIVRAAEAIRDGQLVIAPTETVYGLFADATNLEAVLRVFAAKGRRPDQPLSVAVPDLAVARALNVRWSRDAERLAEAFWPGALTLVLPLDQSAARSPKFAVSEAVLGDDGTLGIRVPAHPITAALLRHADLPLVATSANESGKPAPSGCTEAVAQVGEYCAFALDSGFASVGVASTVVSVSEAGVNVLRAGALSEQELRRALG
ncbi:MAG: threonylcarbamoyl-AMP synthase [Armatimonadota bacterium]